MIICVCKGITQNQLENMLDHGQSKKDILRLAKYTDLPIKDFINLYCDKTDGFVHFKERRKNGECQFLEKKRCSIYAARPTQCRT